VRCFRFALLIACLLWSLPAAAAANAPAWQPAEFAFTFSPGYGTIDHFAAVSNRVDFENLLVNMKSNGFNTIHCVYRDWRADLCRKHGVRMMVDVLAWKEGAETDIRRNEEQRARVKAICEASRGDSAIWGYNLWNERLDWFGKVDGRDVNDYLRLLKEWDPTHPVWVGTYRNDYLAALKETPPFYAYYDYHWERGMPWHFANLEFYRKLSAERGALVGSWLGAADYNRDSYSLNTSIACGLKAAIWYIGAPFDAKGKPDEKHRFAHLLRVGRETKPLYAEIMKLGRPLSVYATPCARTPDNGDQKPAVPAPLNPFPTNFWLQVPRGEVVAGFFRYADGTDAAFIANNNAYAWQGLVLETRGEPRRISRFDRETSSWVALGARPVVSLALPPALGMLLRFEKGAAADPEP
jgi:hypothetical protein